VEEIARVYADALFAVAKEKGSLDVIREQLGAFADALHEHRELAVFLFSPYFSSAEKLDGLSRAISDADPELINFLELLTDKHRMPAIFRIRSRFEELWAEENRRLEVRLVSAVELDPKVVEELGKEIERRTGRTVDVESQVDDRILGGMVLQVGNIVLDASIRNKLEKLRKEVAQAA
jgi:F-type H+-transporting ATPase subunit delta